MPAQEPRGPFCQSCAMPLNKPEDFGTDPAGYRVNDFCRHCFARARAIMTDALPRLKRWRTPAGVA